MRSTSLIKVTSLLVLLLNVAAALDVTWLKANQQSVGIACKGAVSGTALYCKKDSTKVYTCQCSDVVGMGAYAYCGYTETEGNESSRKRFQDYFMSKCPGLTRQKIEDSYNNVTKYITTTSSIPNFNKTVPIRTPVKYSEKLYVSTYKSNYQRWLNVDYGTFFGMGLIGYWAAIFLVFGIFRALELMNLSDKFVTNTKLYKSLQSNVFFKPFIGKNYKKNYFFGYVPVTMDVIIILIYVIIDIVGCFVHIHFLPNSTIWPKKSAQLGRLIGDRTGHIAIFTINLTFLFAGRNNFMLWCTGWNFQSFITYHKWVSRMTVFNVVSHAIAFYISSKTSGNLDSRSAQNYYRWGAVAVVSASAIALQATFPVRKYVYEIFLYVHIILAVFFLVGAWIHLVNFDLQQYVFASVGLWSLDRLLRIIRIAGFGGYKKANITVVNDEFLVITVKSYNSKAFKPQPGNFVFAYFGLQNCFWQSHPFTVVSCDPTNGVKIMAKIKKGCTNKVYKHIVSSSTSCCEVAVALEGPYGVSKERLVSRDQNILMYSTNTGVSGPYYYLESMIKKGTAQGKNIKFYWSIRNWSTLEMFSDELKLLSEQDSIDVFVYISQYDSDRYSESSSNSQSELEIIEQSNSNNSSNKSQIREKMAEKSASTDSLSMKNFESLLPQVTFRPGRLPVNDIVLADISECLDNTNITVMTCGHPELCDDIREIVLQNVKIQKNKNIRLIDELQTW
ncbi:hypothetical protein ACO0QE_000059 [Hanseniaspora vineae]